ncbi:MAG TPA: MATE family efflux transporter [Armatimonadota bacterium]|jgi:MATE family multidrug resistance protein
MSSTVPYHTALSLQIPRPPLSRRALREWWRGESGYHEVLALAWPLFLSQGSMTILQFIDRMFLTWYSPAGMAAAGSSGMLSFTMQALFLGLTGYAGVFVAQYTGAGKPRQAIAAVWQALYLSVLASLIILLLLPVGGLVFRLAGHDPAMQALERVFFTICLCGSFAFIASSALSAYFIGRGLTRIVLRNSLVSMVINIVLDYLLIFGHFGCPRLGVAGAALSSVLAQTVALVLYFLAFLRESNVAHARGTWRPDFTLARRMVRYGLPNGLQFALDMIGWTTFLLLIGRLGVTDLAASNLAFQINSLAFFPIIGFAMAASTLVGQNLGKSRADLADRAVWSAIHLSLCFTGVLALCFLFIPGWLLAPFGAEADPVAFAPVKHLTIIMLRFVAAYCLLDVGNLIFASALKGAGDTLFVMLLSTSITTLLMLVPMVLWCIQPGGLGVIGAWGFLTLAVCVLAFAFLIRYLKGHWRHMRVIEHEVI